LQKVTKIIIFLAFCLIFDGFERHIYLSKAAFSSILAAWRKNEEEFLLVS